MFHLNLHFGLKQGFLEHSLELFSNSRFATGCTASAVDGFDVMALCAGKTFHEGRGSRGGYNNRFQGGQTSSYRGGYRNQYQGRYNDNTSGGSNSQEGYTAPTPPAPRLQITSNVQPAQSAMTSTALAVQPVAKREFQNSSRECSRNLASTRSAGLSTRGVNTDANTGPAAGRAAQ